MDRRRFRGFTYLAVLFLVTVAGIALALLGEVWATVARRDKEQELLYVGNQYRRAIESYFRTGQQQYPRTLQDLVKDPRMPGVRRHIRQLYPDPMTGKDWVLVKAPDGGILGVYSSSPDKPFKTGNFKTADRAFEGAAKYSDWKFVFGTTVQSMPQQQVAPPGTAAPGNMQAPPLLPLPSR